MLAWGAPLRARSFARLLTSYTINELGDSVGVVALSVLVFDRAGVVSTTAFFVIAKFLPALLAPLLVPALDQRPLRAVLPALYVVEAAAFAGLALIADGSFLLVPVFALGFIDGALALVGRGLTRGAIAQVLQPVDLLHEGNALVNVGFAVASVGGAALAGVLIQTLGLSAALLLDAASFLLIALLLAATRDLPRAEIGVRERWRARLTDGLRAVGARGPIRRLIVGQACALICFTLIIPIEVVYARETLGTTSAGFGAMLAAWGAGIVLGSLIFIAIRRRNPLAVILASSAAVGVAYVGMALTSELLVACACSVLGGTGNGIQWVAVVSALQAATPTDLQARVTGLLESVAAALPGAGYVLGGALAALGSPQLAYAVAGTGVLVLVVLGAIARPSLAPAEPVGARRD